ncbi:MAG: LuxR C-terminal-related transcriptional regulator [Treponemataceae bacterium]
MIPFIALLSLLIGVSYLWVGGFILAADCRGIVNRLFALLCLMFAVWSFGAAGLSLSGDASSQVFWERAAYFGAEGYVCVGFFLFLGFAGRLRLLRDRPLILISVALPMLSLHAANLGWNLVSPRHGPTLWYYAHHLICHTVNFIGLAFVWRWSNRTRLRRERLQARCILWSTVVGILVGAAVEAVLDPLGYTSQGNIVPFFWVLGISFAINEYGLLRISPSNATRFLMDGVEEQAFLVDPAVSVAELNASAGRLIGKSGTIPVTDLFLEATSLKLKLERLAVSDGSHLEIGIMARTPDGAVLLRTLFYLVRDKWADPIGFVGIAHRWSQVGDLAVRYRLSEREGQVLNFILAGARQKEIAVRLCLSLPTIKSHTTSLYNKLGVSSRNEVWAMCVEDRLKAPEEN